ncbi:hypothetical protein LO763_05600 [Glycomyces sp. A-F 0318]|uniref:hypothetical protein n=1 Tax=Glycomyces amatae TaxID=2881355 RepID=UPI001E4A1F62|nr:hypothetical protein [Glycomyces amatae]MCD0443102.1 hypothetical protein [Glycomyces amatae]
MTPTAKLALLMGVALTAMAVGGRGGFSGGTPSFDGAAPRVGGDGPRVDADGPARTREGGGASPSITPDGGTTVTSHQDAIGTTAALGRPGGAGGALPVPDFDRMSAADRAAYGEFLDGADAMFASIDRRLQSLNGRVDDLLLGQRLDRIRDALPGLTEQARDLRGEIHGLADRFDLGERRLEQLFPETPELKPGTDTDYVGQLSTFQRWGMGVALSFEALFAGTGATVPDSHQPHPAQYEQSATAEGAQSTHGAPETRPYGPLDREAPSGPQSADPPPNAPKPGPSPDDPRPGRGPLTPPTEQPRNRPGGRKDD